MRPSFEMMTPEPDRSPSGAVARRPTIESAAFS
jgi:hypothetical protein